MPPNLELFLIAFLHGSLVAAAVLVAVAAAAALLFLAFSLGLLSAVALDILSVAPLASRWFEAAKADLELAFVLAVCAATDRGVGVALALKPLFHFLAFEFKANVRRLRSYVDALKLN